MEDRALEPACNAKLLASDASDDRCDSRDGARENEQRRTPGRGRATMNDGFFDAGREAEDEDNRRLNRLLLRRRPLPPTALEGRR